MTAQIEDELKRATYHVDLTTEGGILHADPRTVEAVLDGLQTTFQALTSGGDSSATDPRFPVNGFPHGRQSYKPLVHLLNKIIDSANRYIPRSQLSELRFYPIGGKIKETYESHEGLLTPKGVGIIGELLTEIEEPPEEPAEEPVQDHAEKSELSWEQIEVTVYSKASVRDLVRQSGTYARCCLLNNQRRFFTLGIGFQYKKLEAYVFVFHHAGLSSSHPIEITTNEGFKGLVKHIVGILSIKDETAYCLDPTRFQKFFYINNRYYESVRLLHVRGTLRGRSTIVHSFQGMYIRILSAGLHLFIAYPAVNWIPHHYMESRMLTLAPGVYHLPDKLTYKLTYPIKGYSEEGPLLSKFNGQFGIADVIGYYECGTQDPHGSTSRLLNDAEFWNIFEQKDHPEGRLHEPEERGLQCIALSGEGKALIDLHDADGGTPSPGELLETILHAIIGKWCPPCISLLLKFADLGHYNLFDKGILHRDVSSGNVMRYLKPIERPALDKLWLLTLYFAGLNIDVILRFDCTKNVNYCRGFLIDSDHAIKWREQSSSQLISVCGWNRLASLNPPVLRHAS